MGKAGESGDMKQTLAEIPQASAARLAGLMYLLAMPAASFSVYYVWPKVNVPPEPVRMSMPASPPLSVLLAVKL